MSRNQAYDETSTLLKRHMPPGIPMPDMMWLEDGGIGLEWRPGGRHSNDKPLWRWILSSTGHQFGDNERSVKSGELVHYLIPILLPNFLKTLSEALPRIGYFAKRFSFPLYDL